MASTFAFTGTYQAVPPFGMPSGDPLITAPVDERQSLVLETAGQLLLTDDISPVSLPFAGLDHANVVMLKVTGGWARLLVYSGAGNAQVVPVDSFVALMSASEPYTQLSLVRQPGTPVMVKYFLGQKAS